MAIGEGLSDIWGSSVEKWAAPTKQNWLIGEEIVNNGVCLRSLRNPKGEGLASASSTGGYPDTYHGTYWDNNSSTNGHTNSTVLSHWFYLLSQGGTGWNNGLTSHAAANNGYQWTEGGIGMSDAEKIVYWAESHYINSSSTYPSVRTNMIQAATDLFGANSCQTINVINAWYAVGVGAKYTGNGGLTISGNADLCTSATYTVNAPPGSTVVWSATSGIVNINTNTGYATRVSNGGAFITATVTLCPGTTFTVTKQISAGAANNYSISNLYVYPNPPQVDVYTTSIGLQQTVTSWSISVNNGGGTRSDIGYPPAITTVDGGSNCGYHTITLTTYNSCGSYSTSSSFTRPGCFRFALSPNPATGLVMITDTSASSYKTAVINNKVIITVFDQANRPLKLFGFTRSSQYNFTVADLVAGTYIVQVKEGNDINNLKLVKR